MADVYHEYEVVYTATASTIMNSTDVDLSWMRNIYDNSDEKKADKLRKKLLRIRSLGK